MGCGGSKLEPGHEAKIHPILRTRLEFITKRHGGLSKKQLIVASAAIVHSKSSLQEEDVTAPPSLPLPLPSSPQGSQPPITPSIEDDSLTFQPIQAEADSGIGAWEAETKYKQQENKEDIETSEKLSSLPQQEGEREYCDDLIGGSPSFRVYCIRSDSDDDELDEIAEQLHSKEFDEDEEVCSSKQSSNPSNEVAVKKDDVWKKRKRGILKLRMITIPKSASIGKSIKHNMQSLSHFPCSSNNHHSQELMQQETSA